MNPETISSTAWLAAGWTMLHFLWIGTLAGLVAGLGRRFLLRASPEARHAFTLCCFLAFTHKHSGIGPFHKTWLAKQRSWLGKSFRCPSTIFAVLAICYGLVRLLVFTTFYVIKPGDITH